MAHVKRNDGLGQVLAQIACSIYWFNPAVWYAVHRLYVERERACDDAVLRLGAPAADYADHLLQIARGMNAKFALTAVSMAHPSELKSRITAILEAGIRRQRASHIAVATLLTLIVGLGLFVAALQITTLAAMTLPTVASRGAVPAPVFYKPAVLAQTPTTATGTKVEGVIVKLGTNEGVADAGVELSPVSSTAKPVVVAAGRDGRFTFDNVAPGEYRLAAARPGFVRAELGQRVASGNGRIISVKADQSTTNLKIELIETGSISGTIRSRNGTPLENVQVQALRYSYKDGRRVLITVRSITTNDLGEYRLFWLPPGDYLVLATLLDVSRSQRLIETRPDGSTAMRMIGPSAGEAILLPNDDASVPFYFPGVTDPLMAEPLTIQSGTNRNSVNINIASLGTRRVRGIVLNLPAPSGNPGDPFAPAPRMRLHPTNASGS
jgi:hypothetical protein